MKIEVLETFLHGTDRFEAGDLRSVTDEVGEWVVSNGWARDVDGRVPTGDRDRAHGRTLQIANGVLTTRATEV